MTTTVILTWNLKRVLRIHRQLVRVMVTSQGIVQINSSIPRLSHVVVLPDHLRLVLPSSILGPVLKYVAVASGAIEISRSASTYIVRWMPSIYALNSPHRFRQTHYPLRVLGQECKMHLLAFARRAPHERRWLPYTSDVSELLWLTLYSLTNVLRRAWQWTAVTSSHLPSSTPFSTIIVAVKTAGAVCLVSLRHIPWSGSYCLSE